jgi:hypothetical protein
VAREEEADRVGAPLRKGDLARWARGRTTGPILGARVPDVGAKEALLSDAPEFYFTTTRT